MSKVGNYNCYFCIRKDTITRFYRFLFKNFKIFMMWKMYVLLSKSEHLNLTSKSLRVTSHTRLKALTIAF